MCFGCAKNVLWICYGCAMCCGCVCDVICVKDV